MHFVTSKKEMPKWQRYILPIVYFVMTISCLSYLQSSEPEKLPQQLPLNSGTEFLDEPPEITPSYESMPSMESLLVKTVFMLIFIISALISAVWLLKKFQKRFTPGGSTGSDRSIELIEKAYLSSKTSVWLIRVDDIPCVVVEGQNSISITQLHPSKNGSTSNESNLLVQ